jgi:uncharacterized protein (TIGR02246 family)
MKPFLVIRVFVFAFPLLLAGCAPTEPPDTRAADEAAIRQIIERWSDAAENKDVNSFVSFYAPDGTVMPPNAPPAPGPDAIRQVFTDLFALPGLQITFATDKVEVARSGDLAYDIGWYELTVNDEQGNPSTTRGKYVVVWKKQTDGSWKVIYDMFSPNS